MLGFWHNLVQTSRSQILKYADIELPNPEELEEQKKDVFSKRVTLCTALFAVILAIISLGGNNAAKQMMLSQQQRDIGIAKDPYFDFAEALLQIAIVMASISILSGSRPVFGISIACAILGFFLCLNGYLLLVRLPLLD
jgi:hypothetical protein